MLAALSGQLCFVLKMGHNLKFDHGVCFLWNDGLHLNKGISKVCLILKGFLIRVL